MTQDNTTEWPPFMPATTAGGSIVGESQHVCQASEWVDILYLVGTGRFWLLTEDAAELLHEAAHELHQWASLEDPDQRNATLSENAGIMECFLPASPISFLSEADREKYQRLSRQLEDVQVRSLDPGAPMGQRMTGGYEMAAIAQEQQRLYQEGKRIARSAGYEIAGDRFYGPWEEEIQQALERYRQARRDAVRRSRAVPPSADEAEMAPLRTLQEALVEYQGFIQRCETQTPNAASAECQLADMFTMEQLRSGTLYGNYLESILDLAALGFATPEYALAAPSPAAPTVRDGISGFDRYNDVLREQAELLAEVETKLQEWQASTGGHTALPLFLFSDERDRYQSMTEELDALHEQAKRAMEAMRPHRVLFWQADLADERNAFGYEKRQLDVLVRNDWPLRECSAAGGERSLSHVSLHVLMDRMATAERNAVAPLLVVDGVLPETLWEAPEQALSHWLSLKGCQPIDWRGEWHDDELGLFQPERFFADLDAQGYEIASLADDATRTRWGETLERILFTGPAKDTLRLFDASAQAQMLRLVGMTQGELKDGISVEFSGPLRLAEPLESELETHQLEVNAGSSEEPLRQEWDFKGTYHLARGEVSLGVLELPKADEAPRVSVRLPARDNEERSLGRYALRLETVAKGFAGASLALSGKVGLSINRDLSVESEDRVSRLGVGANLKAFAGVRGGLESRCELRWEPPEDIAMRAPMHQAMDAFTRRNQLSQLQEWRSLGMVKGSLESGKGKGFELDYQLGIHNGKFVLRAKAALFFGPGASGSVGMELDNRHLDLWLTMLHRDLVANGYEHLDWLDEEAFEEFSNLGYVLTLTLLNTGLLLAQGREWFRSLRHELSRSERAGPIALALTRPLSREQENQRIRWVQQLTPEALGSLLFLLSSTPQGFSMDAIADRQTMVSLSGDGGDGNDSPTFSADQALDYQQIAIANCLEWIVDGMTRNVYGRWPESGAHPAQLLFTKAVARMTVNGRRTTNFAGLDYQNGIYALDDFMKRLSGSTGLIAQQAQDARASYKMSSAQLSSHLR
ncbi:hypothetical protein HOP62_02400 [Halomonas sp. MCCC 1A17488]|uniref:hypothetical protein n=1 Tax=unclassified Halomonas TaxID=2609666 RepID=UPI0018D1FA68|nr:MULTISPECIES: hypothetical protein [unclassified Halomonas]MCE8014925.1 hypothetical protein [Halomonas sp. MCCC 1A17488]MCG3238258.1 hypothetical protein [Halomonas sp. MCCC 1A17488]QPP47979.1 hypothetical protein I4484_12000 [Halomonas sp. SS10-MC5]